MLLDDDASSADVLFHFRNSPHDEPVAFTAKMVAGPIPLPKNELLPLDLVARGQLLEQRI